MSEKSQMHQSSSTPVWPHRLQLAPLVRVVVSLLLLLLLAVSFASGLLAESLGLSRFVIHSYSAYALVVLAVIHVILAWRTLVTLVRRSVRRVASDPSYPAQVSLAPVQPRSLRRDLLIAGSAGLIGVLLGRLRPRATSPALDEEADPGLAYHRLSTPGHADSIARALSWGVDSTPHREAVSAQRFALLPEMARSEMTLVDSVNRRRSLRDYSSQKLTPADLSLLLHCTAGVTDQGTGFRAAPSAGALYPLETYAVVNGVDGLEKGLYHYSPGPHSMLLLQPADLRGPLLRACLGQQMLSNAGVVIVLTAVFGRTRARYGDRAYRYVMLEAGHVGQNFYLTATALGLGACAIGAFYDNQLNQLLGVDGTNEAVVYVLTVGSLT